MSRSVLSIMMLFSAGICAGQGAESLVAERKLIELPEFASSRQIARYATPVEYAEAKADAAYSYERLLYRSNGAIVSGFLYSPKSQTRKLPAIVFSRGSLIVNNQAPVLLTMIRRLAREGFVVFAPMFRGSDGTKGQDELGGADLDDLKNAIEVVRSMPAVDADNVFLYGESRGGMMTYFALRENWPVRAAAVWGGITDIADYLKSKDPDWKLAKMVWPAYDSERDAIHVSRSAIRWPDKIRKPILIMHGGEDTDVSPLHSLKMAEALTELKREYSLVIFANDDHILSRNRGTRDRLAVDWFNRHRAGIR
jgi:dipeptidyl aminopeptidase/acylaminoacyl peptidase